MILHRTPPTVKRTEQPTCWIAHRLGTHLIVRPTTAAGIAESAATPAEAVAITLADAELTVAVCHRWQAIHASEVAA